MSELIDKKCVACEGGVPALTKEKALTFLASLHEWTMPSDATFIEKKFTFKNFYHTMAFVNAIAYIANRENHHPDIKLGYNYCEIVYTTHAVSGLTENDFICAAKIDAVGRF